MKTEVRKFEQHLGIVLPDQLIASLRWKSGDVLEVKVENNSLKIVRVETAVDRGMRIASRAMQNYRGALEALAKE